MCVSPASHQVAAWHCPQWNDFSDLPGFQHLPRLITVLGISMMINLAAQTTKKKFKVKTCDRAINNHV